jgi:hypothetical protein
VSDDQAAVPQPDPDEPPGWRVLDADGNVVATGGLSEAKPAGRVAELIDQQQAASEGEQQ